MGNFGLIVAQNYASLSLRIHSKDFFQRLEYYIEDIEISPRVGGYMLGWCPAGSVLSHGEKVPLYPCFTLHNKNTLWGGSFHIGLVKTESDILLDQLRPA